MKTQTHLLLTGIMALVLLAASCKQTTRVCLLDNIEYVGGDHSEFTYDAQDRLIQLSAYDSWGFLNVSYKLYYNSDGNIDHVDMVTNYNVIVQRLQAVYTSNGTLGNVYDLDDPGNTGNPTVVDGHYTLTYDAAGEIDAVYRYNNVGVLIQTYDVTYTNGNLTYVTEVGTNIEKYYTYDDHPGGRSAIHEFYKFVIPYSPVASKFNVIKEEVYTAGILTSTTNYTITYNGDGMVEYIDTDLFNYTCTDREQ